MILFKNSVYATYRNLNQVPTGTYFIYLGTVFSSTSLISLTSNISLIILAAFLENLSISDSYVSTN